MKRRLKLHINEDCNQKCVNCYSSKEKHILPLRRIYNLIEECKTLNLHKFDILGGEPLLRKDIFQIINYAKTAGMDVTLFTNATLVSKNLAEYLKGSGLDAAIITLHSHKKEVHDAITRRHGTLEKVVQGIENLISAGIRTYTNTPVTSQNLNHVKEINEFVKRLGAKALYVKNIPKDRYDPLLIKNKTEWGKFMEWLFYKKSEKCNNFLLRDLKKAREKGYICPAFYNMISIKADGDVTVCPFSDFTIGNLYTSDLINIIQDTSKSNSQLNKEFFKIPAKCMGCSLATTCRGGCKVYTKKIFGSYSKKDPLCRGPWKKKIPCDEIGKYITYH